MITLKNRKKVNEITEKIKFNTEVRTYVVPARKPTGTHYSTWALPLQHVKPPFFLHNVSTFQTMLVLSVPRDKTHPDLFLLLHRSVFLAAVTAACDILSTLWYPSHKCLPFLQHFPDLCIWQESLVQSSSYRAKAAAGKTQRYLLHFMVFHLKFLAHLVMQKIC